MTDKAKSIFAGIKLTEQTALAPPGPDQRLFSRPTSAAPSANGAVPTPAGEEQAATDGLREESEIPDATIPRKVGIYKPKNLGTKEPKKVGSQAPGGRAAAPPHPAEPAAPSRFNFELRPGHQANFVFTDEELDALDDAKRDARRTHGLSTTKQDIVRYAVIDLLDDFTANGEESRLIRWLKQRPHRR